MDMKLDVVVVPVSDVDRAKNFCTALGWRLGADPSEVFHDAAGVFHHAGTDARLSGPDPQRRSNGSSEPTCRRELSK
jgi:catechol 2,3-dioxygenase-like lactoylglutathione lyase family enzyme